MLYLNPQSQKSETDKNAEKADGTLSIKPVMGPLGRKDSYIATGKRKNVSHRFSKMIALSYYQPKVGWRGPSKGGGMNEEDQKGPEADWE